MMHVEAGGGELLRDPGLGGAAVAEQHVAALAEYFQRVNELMIVHLVDCGVDGAAAAVGIVQKAQNLVQCVARKIDRKSTRLNSSHPSISYAVFCLKKK